MIRRAAWISPKGRKKEMKRTARNAKSFIGDPAWVLNFKFGAWHASARNR